MPMTAGIIKHRLYLCLLLFFLFVCMDLHLNWQDTLHCCDWIVWIAKPDPQDRENCKLTQGIPSGNSRCSQNSSCKFSQDPSSSQIPWDLASYPATIFFHTNLTCCHSFLYIYQSQRSARHFVECQQSHFLDYIFG